MRGMFLLVFLIIYFLPDTVSCENDTELLFVQILWRHGDRAPMELYANDPNSEKDWPLGLGKLTKLGMKQHYALGQYLRQFYAGFTTSDPKEVNVISTDYDRCIQSALANLAGFFAPSPDWKFDETLNWQPIVVHYLPGKEDKLLAFTNCCQKAEEEIERVMNLSLHKSFMDEHHSLIEIINNNTEPQRDLTELLYVADTVMIEEKHHLKTPDWTRPYLNELSEITEEYFEAYVNSSLLLRLKAGPLIEHMIDLMQKKISGTLPQQKFEIYSAHDANVALIMNALGVYNWISPPYCATLLFELHYNKTSEKHVVRMLYQNSTAPEERIDDLHVLTLDGCSEFCPLDTFIDHTKYLIPLDWEQECSVSGSENNCHIN